MELRFCESNRSVIFMAIKQRKISLSEEAGKYLRMRKRTPRWKLYYDTECQGARLLGHVTANLHEDAIPILYGDLTSGPPRYQQHKNAANSLSRIFTRGSPQVKKEIILASVKFLTEPRASADEVAVSTIARLVIRAKKTAEKLNLDILNATGKANNIILCRIR